MRVEGPRFIDQLIHLTPVQEKLLPDAKSLAGLSATCTQARVFLEEPVAQHLTNRARDAQILDNALDAIESTKNLTEKYQKISNTMQFFHSAYLSNSHIHLSKSRIRKSAFVFKTKSRLPIPARMAFLAKLDSEIKKLDLKKDLPNTTLSTESPPNFNCASKIIGPTEHKTE